tara:strand:- start:2243 stop:2692 length:450 start_codon:yes stop_codon:yes gene_type:complete
MKLQNKSYIFLLLFFFTACVARKSTIEYKERVVRDTIKVETVKTIVKPIKEFVTIENPCDSLGILKQFDKEIKTELSSVRVFNDKGTIKAEINIDSLKSVLRKEFKSNNKTVTETKEVKITKYKYPLWLILALIISILINILLVKKKIF